MRESQFGGSGGRIDDGPEDFILNRGRGSREVPTVDFSHPLEIIFDSIAARFMTFCVPRDHRQNRHNGQIETRNSHGGMGIADLSLRTSGSAVLFVLFLIGQPTSNP